MESFWDSPEVLLLLVDIVRPIIAGALDVLVLQKLLDQRDELTDGHGKQVDLKVGAAHSEIPWLFGHLQWECTTMAV